MPFSQSRSNFGDLLSSCMERLGVFAADSVLLSPVRVMLQVTKGTVDEGIHAMAERKLRLDAAVLDGVTATGDGKSSGATVETAQVLLTSAACQSCMHLPHHPCKDWYCWPETMKMPSSCWSVGWALGIELRMGLT